MGSLAAQAFIFSSDCWFDGRGLTCNIYCLYEVMMRVCSILLAIILGAIIGLAALNWNLFTASSTLWLGIASMQAPLGLIMLCLVAALLLLFLMMVAYMQSSILLETRRHVKELQTQRELAERAEASRFTAVQRSFELGMQSLAQRDAETHAALVARLELLGMTVTHSVEQSGNTLAAYIAELEDRMEAKQEPPRT
jgi:hypothetical protein